MKAIIQKGFRYRLLLRTTQTQGLNYQSVKLFSTDQQNDNESSDQKKQNPVKLNQFNQISGHYKPDPKISLIIKSNASDLKNVYDKDRFNKLIRETALGLYRNYKKTNNQIVVKNTEEFILNMSKSLDGKTFTLFIKHLGELRTDVLENHNHKLTPDSFLIFLDKIKNLTHSQALNDLILRKMIGINIDELKSKKMLNQYQKHSIDFKFEENIRMDEIKQFANEVIPKPRFIFDNYKTTLNNSPTEEPSENQSDIERRNENEDYFSFFSSHEKIILKPESNFKNLRQFMEFLPIDYYILLQENFETKSEFKRSNSIFFTSLPLIQKKRNHQKTTVVKNITFEDIKKAGSREEITQIVNDEYAADELIDHLEKRFGKIANMFYINYNAQLIIDTFSKSNSYVKSDEIASFEETMNNSIKNSDKAKDLQFIDAENPDFSDLLSLAQDSLEETDVKSSKMTKAQQQEIIKIQKEQEKQIVNQVKMKEKQLLGLENQIMRSGFLVFNSYYDKLKFMSTPLFLFGMKIHNQQGHLEFYDADFCNTITVSCKDLFNKTLGECCHMLNHYLLKSGFESEVLKVGQLKGLSDFDLNKILVREQYKISLRFHNFEEALNAFKCLSNMRDERLISRFNCLFQNPIPNFYDGKFSTMFESCIKDKFEGLAKINEIDADYVRKSIEEIEKASQESMREHKQNSSNL